MYGFFLQALVYPGTLSNACEVCFPSQPAFTRVENPSARNAAALGKFLSSGSLSSGSLPRPKRGKESAVPLKLDPGTASVPEKTQHHKHR